MTEDPRLVELLLDWQERYAQGQDVPAAELCRDCPDLAGELDRRIAVLRHAAGLARQVGCTTWPQPPAAGTKPEGGAGSDPDRLEPVDSVVAWLRSAAPPQQPGELGRLGPYAVVRLLGRGGMGAVFAADDPALGRRVALKVMRPEVAAGPEAKARFLREARAAAALQHDHVIPIHHVGEHNGVPFIVMPLLAGESLEDRLRRESPLPAAEVVRVGREAAAGLAAAHAAGLVHRDVKPDNLWLEAGPGGPGGRVKVLDFGLARVATGGGGGLTQTGEVLGTPAYMSPEQAHGQPLDGRSDLFSLGCVLYRLATGEPPFRGPTPTAELLAVVGHHPPPPREVRPELPAALSGLIMRLLAKDPDRRPATARAVASALAHIATEPAPPTEPAPVLPSGAAPRAGPALRGVLDVWVWPKDQSLAPARRLHGAGVLPLKPGDLLRIEATLNRPAYLYLVWLDASGRASPLWPWVNGDWGNRPDDRDRKRSTLSLPELAYQGAPLDPGPSGVEALLLLARNDPLPADEDVAGRFAGLPKQPGLDPLRPLVAVWFEDGEPVRDEPDRAPINLGQAQTIGDPVWRTRALLRGELRRLFPYTRAVCFTFQGQ
jgi:serine/threonine protein kinase